MTQNPTPHLVRRIACVSLLACLAIACAIPPLLRAAPPFCGGRFGYGRPMVADNHPVYVDPDGTWYWMRGPEQEQRVITGLYNRYCIRCHGVDGRGVWDIPDVPDFADARWQASRSDDQLARAIMQGRGACMPPFRGAMTLEEAWAMARYLRTLIPGSEMTRPGLAPAVKEPSLPAPRPAP